MNNYELKISVLVDNYVTIPGLKAEHGLSILIETGLHKILFDCGQSSLLIENAKKLNLGLMDLDKIVLSHGHYDHTGGLASLLEYIGKEIEIYAHTDIFDKKYSRKGNEKPKYIGIPESKSFYEKLGAKFILTKNPLEICKDVLLTGEITTRIKDFETTENYFYKEVEKELVKDEILDDISVLINTKEGMVLITGCAHRGLINIIEHIKATIGKDKFRYIIGGFHLSGKSNDYILNTINRLKEYDISNIAPAHCTGRSEACRLMDSFGSKCNMAKTGLEIIL